MTVFGQDNHSEIPPKRGIFQKRTQSPSGIHGYLTRPRWGLDISAHWVYNRIDTGRVQMV